MRDELDVASQNAPTNSGGGGNTENVGIGRYTPVRMDDSFPSSGAMIHTAHSIEWSPHNVLAVVNQWSVQFHTHSLQAPAATVYPTYTSRGGAAVKRERVDDDFGGGGEGDENEDASQSGPGKRSAKKSDASPPSSATTSAAPSDVIVSGKWATGIIPQPHHPVAARFALLTASGSRLAVYVVVRHGERGVQYSAPVMCCAVVGYPAKRESLVKLESRDDADLREARQTTMSRSSAPRILDFLWMAQDALVVVTTAGLHLLTLPEHTASESSELTIEIPPCAIEFTSTSGGRDSSTTALMPNAVCRVQGYSARNAAAGSNREDVAPANVDSIEEMVALAAPGAVALCVVQHRDARRRMYVQRIVKTPQLFAMPSAVGAAVVLDAASGAPRAHSISLYVATPFAVTLGTVPAHAHDLEGGDHPETVEWTLRRSWGANDVCSEPCIRAFHMFSLPPTPSRDTEAVSPESPCSGTLDDAAIIAVGKGNLFGLVGGESCVPLFRCHNVDRVAVWPPDAMAAVSGIAVHRSLSVAVMLMLYGRRYSRFLHVAAVGASADNECSPLYVLLEAALRLRRARTRVLDAVSAADVWLAQHPRSSFEFEELLRDHVGCTSLASYHQQMAIIAGRKPLTGSRADSMAAAIHRLSDACRSEYLHYKTEFGIEVYLRFPQPNAAWRVALRRFASFSRDLAALRCECVLSNAIVGAMRWFDAPSERIHSSNFSVRGALEYIDLYCTEAKAQEEDGSETVLEYGTRAVLWTVPSFTAMLQEFAQLAWKKLRSQESIAMERTRFTCSVCSRPNSARMALSLASYADDEEHIATMETEGRHCTLFCPLTFTPIALYDETGAESRCLRCGQHCRTTAALCALCGGMLM